MGQAKQKKVLTKEKYALWHQLFPGTLSEKGNWISYTHHYKTGTDTLFVTHTGTKKTVAIPKGNNGTFIGEDQFICQQPDNVLYTVNLQTSRVKTIPNVAEFAVSGTAIVTKSVGRSGEIQIIDSQGKAAKTINGVIEWKWNPAQTHLACVVEESGSYKAIIVGIRDGFSTTIEQSSEVAQGMQWQPNGFGIAFVKKSEGSNDDRGTVCYYDLKSKSVHRYVLSAGNNLPKTMAVSNFVTVSEDGERVFFYIDDQMQTDDKDPKSVQVWNTADKEVYPGKIATDGWQSQSKVAVWWPKTGDCRQLTDNNLPALALTGDQRFAITSNPLAYAPQFKKFGDRDYVITDLQTGEQKLLLEAASGAASSMLVSPEGKFVTYFSNGSWWNYNIATATHHKLLVPELASGAGSTEVALEDSPLYGSPVWDTKDKAILLYDAYDIWKVKPDGSSAIRLTHGRETRTVFRWVPQSRSKSAQFSFDGTTSEQTDLAKPQFLTAYNERDGKTGVFVLMPGQKEKPLVYKNRLISYFSMAPDCTHFYYMEQDFDLSPQLRTGALKDGHHAVVAKSNTQQADYFWGKSERITYSAMGKEVSGVLMYPANYNPNKKYPMVVEIYENMEKELHLYTLPQLPESRGFNVTNYMLQDYFVFLPTIIPVVGDTGNAAVAFVNAAIEKVVENRSIDRDRMGLLGHSYGGFEANFIATQKHPFRTIISGAGIVDLATDFLDVNEDANAEDFWFYESGQLRMGKSLFEDRERYYRNSPLYLLEGVNVPILIWTGGNDRHVDEQQSVKLYMALRRLKKQAVLLVYPEEKHVLNNPKNRRDLWQKMEEWFEFYLKDGPIKPWMQPEHIEK